MFSRVIDLSLIVPSITPLNVWDLPLWAWRSYAAVVDDQREKSRRAEQEARRG